MHTHTYTQVRQEAAKYAFAHGDDARVGAHAVLAAYFVGRDAPKAWTTLPKVHPLHQICACAHAMLMRNPVFPSQPWYWDAVEASGEGGDQADGVGAGGSGVTGEAGAGKSSTGKERVYNVRKLQGLVRHLVGAGLLDAAQQLLTDLEYLTIKFEARRVYELVEEFEVVRLSKKAHGRGDSCFLDAAGQFETFVLQSRSLFEHEPHALFQAAANTQEDGPMSRAAALTRSLHQRHPPWLRWVNAPRDNDVASCWTLQAHQDRVTALAVSVDGAWLATACADRVCRIWETASGINMQTLARAPGRVTCMAWSQDSHYLAVGDAEGGAKMWLRKRREASSSDVADFGVTAHMGPVQGLAFAEGSPAQAEHGATAVPDSADKVRMLLSAGTDGVVKVWSTATNSVVRVLKGHQGAVHGIMVRQSPAAAPGTGFMARVISQRLARRREQLGQRKSPHKGRLPPIRPQEHANGFTSVMDQRGAASDAKIEGREGARVLSFGEDRCVREWQVDSGLCVRTFRGHRGAVMSVDVAEGLDLMVSASEDKTCFMWRLSDGSVVGILQHDTPLSCVVLDLASDSLATICKEGRLRLWDLQSMVRVGKTDAIGLHSRTPGQRLEGLNKASALDRDKGLVLVGTLGGCVKAFPIRAFSFRAHDLAAPDAVQHTSASPSRAADTRKAGAAKGASKDVDTGDTGVGGKGVTAVCVNRSSMCSASSSGEIALWNLKTGDNLWRLSSGQRRITALAIEPSAGRLLASASSHGEVLFWDLEQPFIKEPIAALAAHVHAITCIAFSGDGGLFLTASSDKTLRVWSVHGAAKATSAPVSLNATEQAHATAVHGPESTARTQVQTPAALSAATSGLSAASSDGHDGGVGAAGVGDTRGADMSAMLRLRALHRLVGHEEVVTSAAFMPVGPAAQDRSSSSAGGVLLASSSLDGSVRLWNLATGEPLLPVLRPMGRSGSIACVAWAPDCQHVAGGCDDGSVRVWSLKEINPSERKSPKKAKTSRTARAEAHETLVLRARGALDVLCASLKTLSPQSLGDLTFLSLASSGVFVCV